MVGDRAPLRVAVAAIVILATPCAVALTSCSSSSRADRAGRSSSEPTRSTTSSSEPNAGSQVFSAHCAACHGTRGEGELGPRLAGTAERLPSADAAEIVRNGRGRMPPFAAALTTAEVDAVVAYIRSLR
jgi:mono/diheme cytochrome c family protein